MARNRRRAERENLARIKQLMEAEADILSGTEVAMIKAKLALEHRSQDDWDEINDLLVERRIILISPVNDYPSIEQILVYEGRLIAFTNVEEAYHHAIMLSRDDRTIFQFGTIGLVDACKIADRNDMELFIDPVWAPGTRFLAYQDGRIEAKALFTQRDAERMLKESRAEEAHEGQGRN